MKISVIIVTYNRCDDIRRSISAYLEQTYKNFEIIVIDNASVDNTRQMLSDEFPQVKYFRIPDNIDILGVNLGVEISDGDLIWRCDSDSQPESTDAFLNIISYFQNNPQIDIIATEDIEVNYNYSIFEWYSLPIDRTNPDPNGYISNTFHGTGAMIRRRVFEKIGGFWGFGLEELDFSSRAILAGFNIRFFPQIRVLHFGAASGRINNEWWLMNSNMYIRYRTKYFSILTVVASFALIYPFQLITGLLRRVSLLTLLEGVFSMPAVAIRTLRKERILIPKDKIYDITFGQTFYSQIFRYIKHVLKNNFRKIFEK